MIIYGIEATCSPSRPHLVAVSLRASASYDSAGRAGPGEGAAKSVQRLHRVANLAGMARRMRLARLSYVEAAASVGAQMHANEGLTPR
jgi:hypothetical protein